MSFDIKGLIIAYREGEESAFERIVEMYTPMLSGVAVSLSLDPEESFSEACMALLRATLSFDISQDAVTFGLYAKVCVKHRLIDYKDRLSGDTVAELDFETVADTDDDVEDALLRREEAEEFCALCRTFLSDYEYRIFELWLESYKTADIAHMLGTSSKSVDNAKARMFKKLREAIAPK